MDNAIFCVGDLVESIVDHPDGNSDIVIGSVGTICTLIEELGTQYAGVFWNVPINCGHDCHHTCSDGYGWFMRLNEIQLVDDQELPAFTSDDLSRLLEREV